MAQGKSYAEFLPSTKLRSVCGRFVSTKKPQELADYFEADEVRGDELISYNVAPTENVWIVNEHDGKRLIDNFVWGLIPSWAKDKSIGTRMINARAEDVTTKPAYKKAFESRRCLVPADGFYEWQRIGTKKQPFYFSMKDGSEMAFAGLWEGWRDRDDPASTWVNSCTIITTDANDLVAKIHDRMPVLLPMTAWEEWLDPNNHDVKALRKLLQPAPSEIMTCWPVTTKVNKSGVSDPIFVMPVELDQK